MLGSEGPEQTLNGVKGGRYVVDDCSNTDNSVGAGTGEQLHDGRVDSRPAGNCYCRDSAQRYPGAQRVACRRLSTHTGVTAERRSKMKTNTL